MTRNALHPAGIVKGLPVLGLLLFGLASGCGSGAPSGQPDTTVGQSQEDFRFPRFCGGLWDPKGDECSDSEFCLPFMSRGCPGPHQFGFCFPRPHYCPKFSEPVCGCDGTTYDNLCDAAQAGVVMEHPGACAPTAPGGCGGGAACPGSGTCTSGMCTCSEVQQCPKGETFNSDPTVCDCQAQTADPCARITCMTGMQCVVGSDGTPTCEPTP